MIVRLATHADRLPKSSQRRSCLLAEPKDTAKSLDEAISVQPLVNSRGAGLAYDFFRFLRRPQYGSVIFIAGNMPMVSEITPLIIIGKLEQYDYAGATAVALVLLVISFLLLLLINGLQAWQRKKS